MTKTATEKSEAERAIEAYVEARERGNSMEEIYAAATQYLDSLAPWEKAEDLATWIKREAWRDYRN